MLQNFNKTEDNKKNPAVNCSTTGFYDVVYI